MKKEDMNKEVVDTEEMNTDTKKKDLNQLSDDATGKVAAGDYGFSGDQKRKNFFSSSTNM